jgi:AraC-like DNA-binding protein
VEARTYAPPDDLRDVVSVFWAGRWDLRGQASHVTELLADPCANLVFESGGEHAGSRLVGIWTKLWRRTLAGEGRVRGAKLRPGALRAFVPSSATDFANRIVPLSTVFEGAITGLERAVIGPEDDEEGFAALASWLSSVRCADDGQASLAIALVARIASDPSITSVDGLAAVAGLGPRALQRLFRACVGAPPKWVIRQYRLQEVAGRIERGDAPNLAALAADLGYTDQAHLARDFKRAVGKTPSAFARACAADRRALGSQAQRDPEPRDRSS